MPLGAVALLLAWCTAAQPAEAPYALVIVPPRARADMPVVVDIDFGAVAKALGLPAPAGMVEPGMVRAALEDGLVPVPCQYDPRGPGRGELVLAPPPAPTSQRVRVYFSSPPPFPAPLPAGRLEVQREGEGVVVSNGFVRVRHDPQRQGGLPSRWEFLATGKVLEAYNNNDRVHSRTLGGFWLRECREAKVELGAQGPLRVVVRVSGYYCRGAERPASKPEAVYEYSYFAGVPYIILRAHLKQQTPFPWDELHITEINLPGGDFTHWATPGARGELQANKTSHRGAGWGALCEGANVLGVVSDSVLIYDGRGEYGTYVHGPWWQWGETEAEATLALYASGAAQGLEQLAAGGGRVPLPEEAYVLTPPLAAALAKLRQGARGPEAAHWKWIAELLLRTARRDLLGASDMATSALKAMGKRPALQWLAEHGLLVASDDKVGICWAVQADRRARLLSLYDLQRGRELLARQPPPIWRVQAENNAGQPIVADSERPVCSASQDRKTGAVVLEWRPLRGCQQVPATEQDKLLVRASFAATGRGQLRMWLKIDNATRLTLAEVTWPQLSLGPLGDAGADDIFVAPLASGKLYPNPYGTGVSLDGLYPNGWTDMQMFGLYDPAGGVLVMYQDPLASTKYIRASSEGHGLRVAFVWPAADHTVPGNDFLPPGRAAVVPHAGDWYDEALLYRAWVEAEAKWWPQAGQAGRPDTPAWMLDLPVWALGGGTPGDCVPAIKAFRAYMGVPCGFHWYNWHQIPFDVHYPEYFPAKPGFAEGVRELQQAGVRVMPYINGRLWDTGNKDFQARAFPFATKDRQGKVYIEEYGSGAKLAPMCPTTKLWQETVQGIVKRLVGPEFNVDGVYIDQVAAASPRLCYDRTHGHPLGGGHWWTTQGYWPMLEKLQSDLARAYPDKMLTTECTAEPFLHCFDGYLSWHWQENQAVPLFPAVYSDKIRLFSRAYGAAGDVSLVRRMKMAQQFVFGEQLGWLDPGVIKDDKSGPFLRRLARLRYALRAYFRGRMLRPPAVEGPVEEVTGDWQWGGVRMVTLAAVQVGAWKAEDGRVAVVLANLAERPQSFTLRLPTAEYGCGPSARIVWRDESGIVARQPARLTAGRLAVQMEPMQAYALELGRGSP
jgi:hypothetical protein